MALTIGLSIATIRATDTNQGPVDQKPVAHRHAAAPERTDALDTGIHAPPRAIDGGPDSAATARIAASLAPAGSVPVSGTDYPDLVAATATLRTPTGNLLTVAIQRLTAAAPTTGAMIGTDRRDRLGAWPSGSRYTDVRHGLPRTHQVMVVRPSGVRVTVTVTSAEPGRELGASHVPDALVEAVRRHVDVPATDGLLNR